MQMAAGGPVTSSNMADDFESFHFFHCIIWACQMNSSYRTWREQK